MFHLSEQYHVIMYAWLLFQDTSIIPFPPYSYIDILHGIVLSKVGERHLDTVIRNMDRYILGIDISILFLSIFLFAMQSVKGLSWSWSYGVWIYNYLCNQCLSPLTLWVRTRFMGRCTRWNIMWSSLSVLFFGHSVILHL
jgi:hypothetical protein